MASIWEGFGMVWRVFWALLGDSWAFFRRSKSSLFKAWVQDGLQEAFWIDFGRVLEGFGEGLGRNLGGFGRFCAGCGQILGAFGKMWPCCSKAYKLDPRADLRSVTMWDYVKFRLPHRGRGPPRIGTLRGASRDSAGVLT